MRLKPRLLIVLLVSVYSISVAQFSWQKPIQRSKAEVAKIVGPMTQKEPSRDLVIVWVWGVDKLHGYCYVLFISNGRNDKTWTHY